MLAERLSHWFTKVLEAGREAPPGKGEMEGADGELSGAQKPRAAKEVPVEHTGGAPDVPLGAVVTPEQAESALGHVQATDYDEGIFATLDEDQTEEEIALIGRVANPSGVDYDCVAWSPVSGSDLAQTM